MRLTDKIAMALGMLERWLWCRSMVLMSVVSRIGSRSDGLIVWRLVDERSRMPPGWTGHNSAELRVLLLVTGPESKCSPPGKESAGRSRDRSSRLRSSVAMVRNLRSLRGLFAILKAVRLSITPSLSSNFLISLRVRSTFRSLVKDVRPSGIAVIRFPPAVKVINSSQFERSGKCMIRFSEILNVCREGIAKSLRSVIVAKALQETSSDFIVTRPLRL